MTNKYRLIGECIKEEFSYKDFVIRREKQGKWVIENLNGQWLRNCRSKRECIIRIDEQRV